MKRTKYTFESCQFKSLESLQRFCAALNEIEEQTSIHEANITLKDVWVCPWIDLEKLNNTPMEILIRDLVK